MYLYVCVCVSTVNKNIVCAIISISKQDRLSHHNVAKETVFQSSNRWLELKSISKVLFFDLCSVTQKKTNVKRKENSSKIVFYLSVLSVPIDPFCFPLFPLLARLLWIVACLELSDDYESLNRNRNWNRNKATKLKERTVIHRCQVRSLAQVRAHLPHALFLFLFFRFLSHTYSICNISQEARTRYKTIK